MFSKEFNVEGRKEVSSQLVCLGRCHDPLPVVNLLAALEYRDSAEDTDKGKVNNFKLC